MRLPIPLWAGKRNYLTIYVADSRKIHRITKDNRDQIGFSALSGRFNQDLTSAAGFEPATNGLEIRGSIH